MSRHLTRDRLAVLAGLAGPLGLAAVLVPFRASVPNTDGALALLLVVVAVAANGYRPAGILAAVSAAAWFDFFLTRPYETFDITGRTDLETTVLLLVIGVAITEIAVWGRREHATASRRASYLAGLGAAAQAVAAGSSLSTLIDQVTSQLTQLLSLQTCRFQQGVAGLGLARLQPDGTVTAGQRIWDCIFQPMQSRDISVPKLLNQSVKGFLTWADSQSKLPVTHLRFPMDVRCKVTRRYGAVCLAASIMGLDACIST